MTAKRKEMGGFKLTHYQPHMSWAVCNQPKVLTNFPRFSPIWLTTHEGDGRFSVCISGGQVQVYTRTLFLSVLLSHFQPNTDTGHLVLFEDCGSILLAVGWLDYIVITHMCPNLLSIFAREPQWAIWWSNQDLHLTHTMLTPYNWHYRSSHALFILLYSASKRAVQKQSIDILTIGASCMSSLKLIK